MDATCTWANTNEQTPSLGFMHIDKARTPESPRSAPTKEFTIEGFEEYPLVNELRYPECWKKRFFVLCITIFGAIVNTFLFALFIVLTLIRLQLQFVGIIKKREVKRGVVGPPKDVSDRKICVVGCGTSSLVFLKEAVEQGMEVKAYDATTQLGGLFSYSYDFGQLTSSNFFTAWSSFPCSENDLPCRTVTFKEYCAYMNRFVDHYKLRSLMNFGTEVLKVEERPDGKFNVVTKAKGTSAQEVTEVFTNVVVCNGVNRHPSIPEIPGKESFKGRVMHSSEYKRPDELTGKRILVIGMGESGSDICLEMASVAKDLLITTRKGPGHVLTRYHNRMPNDVETSYAYHSIPRKMFVNPMACGKGTQSMPLWWRTKIWVESAFNVEQDDKAVEGIRSVDYTRYHWMCRYGTKTTGFIKACTDYGASYKETEAAKIDEKGVEFTDGTRYDCDVIFFCTGFKREMSILPEDLKNLNYRNDLWKKCLHPKYGNRLGFIGFNRPAIGAIPPLAELSARYLALSIAGRLPLHTQEEMMKTIKKERDYEEWLFPYDAKRLHSLCSHFETYIGFNLELGTDLRFMELLFKDPVLFHRLLFCQVTNAATRLFGYGSDYKTARKAVMITGMVPLPVQVIKTSLLLFSFCAAQLGLTDVPTGFHIW